MNDLLRQRLLNQRLARSDLKSPAEVVAWLGAVQAQDYHGAKWGLGVRGNAISDVDVERAFDEGAILRTHALRPTWHFVVPADIRSILSLTGPRVHALNAYCYRQCELDARTLTRSRTAIERALRDGQQLTRMELAAILGRARIPAEGMRLAYLMMHAELNGVICSGPRRGKQFTYALLEERVPPVKTLDRDHALAEFIQRYFTSHGPATVRDFVWWSGLSAKDAKAGIDLIGSALARETIDGRTYWFVPQRTPARKTATSAHLLPNYDEFLIAYKDRQPVVLPARERIAVTARDFAFPHFLVVDGRLAGTWKRRIAKDGISIDLAPFRPLRSVELRAVQQAATRHGRFMDAAVTLAQPYFVTRRVAR